MSIESFALVMTFFLNGYDSIGEEDVKEALSRLGININTKRSFYKHHIKGFYRGKKSSGYLLCYPWGVGNRCQVVRFVMKSIDCEDRIAVDNINSFLRKFENLLRQTIIDRLAVDPIES